MIVQPSKQFHNVRTTRRSGSLGLRQFQNLRLPSLAMDTGVPLATIQSWLGHSTVAQTSTYLATTSAWEHEAMRKFEARRAAASPRPEQAAAATSEAPAAQASDSPEATVTVH